MIPGRNLRGQSVLGPAGPRPGAADMQKPPTASGGGYHEGQTLCWEAPAQAATGRKMAPEPSKPLKPQPVAHKEEPRVEHGGGQRLAHVAKRPAL